MVTWGKKKIMKKILLLSLILSSVGFTAGGSFSLSGPILSAPNSPAGALDCDNGVTSTILYQQPIDVANFGTARSSDEEAGFLVSEDIVNGAGVIAPLAGGMTDSVSVWGISAEFNAGFLGECLEDDAALTPFNITFSADNAGTPGAIIASVVGIPVVTDTTTPFAFATIHKYDLSFPTTDITGAAWISIQRQTGASTPGGNQCLFLWLDETLVGSYDDQADQNGGVVPSDQVMCISEAAVVLAPPVPVPSLTWYSLVLLLLMMLSGSALFYYKKKN